MKKSFIGLLTALLLISIAGCKNGVESGEGSGSENENTIPVGGGDLASNEITINGILLENTAEVYVTGPNGATITGKTNSDNYAGVFINGRTVSLSPFIMSKYEVTQELYTAVMTNQAVSVGGQTKTLASAPFYCKADSDDYKVLLSGEEQKYRAAEGMTWYDAVFFCNALSEKTGLTNAYTITNITVNGDGNITSATVELVANANGYRLPTEAEWEFAARGGDPTKPAWDYTFSGAPIAESTSYLDFKNTGLDAVGWYWFNTASGSTGNSDPSSGEAGYGTHQVGKKNANALGIFDMSGNVWEWCHDWYDTISTGSETDPVGPASGSYRVYRGGGWSYDADNCTVALHNFTNPYRRTDSLGFRVVRNAN